MSVMSPARPAPPISESRLAAPPSRLVAAALLAAGVPFLHWWLLRGSLSPLLLAGIVALLAGLGAAYRIWPSRWLRLGARLAACVLALAVLAGILMTPYSVYLVWAEMLDNGLQRGAVSNLFVLTVTLFASVIGPMVLTSGLSFPVLLLALATCGLWAVMVQAAALFWLFLALAVACLGYLALGSRSARGRGASLAYASGVLLALAALIGSLAGSGEPRRSHLVDQTLHPWLRQTAVSLLPRFPLLYAIPGYGYSYSQRELGAPPSLSAQPLFDVEAAPGQTLYLRTVIYDRYDGRAWTATVENVEYEGVLPRPRLVRGSSRVRRDIRLTLDIEFYSRLPHTIDTVRAGFQGRTPPLVAGDLRTGMTLSPSLKFGDSIVLERGEPLYHGGPEELMTAVGTAGGPRRRGQERSEAEAAWRLRRAYLDVPAELPVEVRRLAARLAEGSGGQPRVILQAIEDYLSSGYRYSISPRRVASGEDFVRGFLFDTREGFCVHFATSFVILARLNGIPARYATGFLVYMPREEDRTSVTGLSSHAWPEVWLDGEWVTWEATHAVDRRYYDALEDELVYQQDIELDAQTSRQIQSLLGSPVRSHVDAAVQGPLQGGSFPWWLLATLPAAGALALLVLRRRLLAAGFRGREARFRMAARRTVRRLGRDGIPSPLRVGWSGWAAELRARFPEKAAEIEAVEGALLGYLYGGEPFDEGWLRSLKGLSGLPGRARSRREAPANRPRPTPERRRSA